MKNIVVAAMIIMVLPASAYAQADKGPLTVRSDAEKKKDAEIEKAYKDALKRSGGDAKAAPVDPWQSVRPAAGDKPKP